MGRPVGRPREFNGPKATVIIQMPALIHALLQAKAMEKGQTMSRVVRDTLTEAMGREWGPVE